MSSKQMLAKIAELNKQLKKSITIMEVCGGHTNTVMRYGIRDELPENINLVSGPGCPVCVTAQEDVDNVVELALQGIPIATYGDMLRVPGTKMSLDDARSQGADVTIIYSADEMLKPENKKRVFFAVGFETTTPMTAFLLSKGITVYSAHKIMIPPMKALLDDPKIKIDGFILPGHVSTVAGEELWKNLGVPGVISGFGEEQILHGVCLLTELIIINEKKIINDYKEVVFKEGNTKAKELVEKTMKLCDASWRGVGVIPQSGLEPKENKLNAKIKYKEILKNVKSKEYKECICGDILKGIKKPTDCKLFGKACTPENPKGACMVSEEGSCQIEWRYRK